MTWSLTLAELPHAGENSKPHDYKQKYKKCRTFRKQVFQRENSLNISAKKGTETKELDVSKNPSGTPRP